MEFTELGWRAGLILAAAVAGVYLVIALVRLNRLGRDRGAASVAPDTQPGSALPPTAEASMASPPFGEQLAWARLEAEVKELQGQAVSLREEVTSLREEATSLREEVSEMKAVRRVSPLYADAVALARRGFDARGIAEECGISVSEAELVLAMSNGANAFDDGVDDGDSGQRNRIEPSGS